MRAFAARILFLAVALPTLGGCLGPITEYEQDWETKACPGRCTVLAGRYLTGGDPARPEPLADLPLQLEWHGSDPNSGRIDHVVRARAWQRTGPDGGYRFELALRDDEVGNGEFVVVPRLDANRYLATGAAGQATLPALRRDSTYRADVRVPRRATLVFALANVAPLNTSGNQFSVLLEAAGVGQSSAPRTGGGGGFAQARVFGTAETEVRYAVPAEQWVRLRLSRLRNGVPNTTRDSVRLRPGQELAYPLAF